MSTVFFNSPNFSPACFFQAAQHRLFYRPGCFCRFWSHLSVRFLPPCAGLLLIFSRFEGEKPPRLRKAAKNGRKPVFRALLRVAVQREAVEVKIRYFWGRPPGRRASGEGWGS